MRFRGVRWVAMAAVATVVAACTAEADGRRGAAPAAWPTAGKAIGLVLSANRTVREVPVHSADARPVPLAEHAGPADRWILDRLGPDRPGQLCPTPSLASMLVLDSDGRSAAVALWILDSREFCLFEMPFSDVGGGYQIARDRLDSAYGGWAENFGNWRPGAPRVAFFRDPQEPVVLRGDDTGAYGPLRQWRIDLGPQGRPTVVEYPLLSMKGVRLPVLCTASGKDCRPGY